MYWPIFGAYMEGGRETNEQSRFWHFLVLEKECVQIDAEYMH
jgi:hypothetical protein